MNPRSQLSPFSNASLTIRQEIQRFESVHPSIYAIYDIIESIPDQNIQQQIREHVVCIEGAYVYLFSLHTSICAHLLAYHFILHIFV